MRATTLFEVRTEPRVIAAQGWGAASARQVAYAIVAVGVAAGLYFGAAAVLGALSTSAARYAGATLAVLGAGLVLLVGFARATALSYLSWLPGLHLPQPTLPGPTDPTLPPLRLDLWLLIVFRHRRRARRLLYKRG